MQKAVGRAVFWKYHRKRLSFNERLQIAAQLDVSGHRKEADRFINCGRRVHVFESEQTGHRYGIIESCRSRLCDRCSANLYRKYLKALKQIIKSLNISGKKRLSFLTLTFKTRTDPEGKPLPLTKSYIRQCIKHARLFMNCFFGKYSHRWVPESGKIVKSKKYIGCGAFSVLEVGKSGNLHFHALVYGYYRPLSRMSEVWKAITKDSYRIQIDQVGYKTKQDPFLAAAYILKYIQKPPPFKRLSELVDYGNMLKSIRRIHTYGIFWGDKRLRAVKKIKLLCPVSGKPLKYVGTAQEGDLVYRYYAIAEESQHIIMIENFLRDMKIEAESKIVWNRPGPRDYASVSMQMAAGNKQIAAYYAKECMPDRKLRYNPNIYARKDLSPNYQPKPRSYFLIAKNFCIHSLTDYR
jgi:hypothetical protein